MLGQPEAGDPVVVAPPVSAETSAELTKYRWYPIGGVLVSPGLTPVDWWWQ